MDVIIQNKIIRKGRAGHHCAMCNKPIAPGPKMRTYGAADVWDQPSVLYFHISTYPTIIRQILKKERK